MRPITVSIQGPTASGKSDLAEFLAIEFDGEIISADSMQIYRGMDIGTAKIMPEDRHVAYHCIDMVEPDHPYSAALFQRDARMAIEDVSAREKLPIICGGTGLYVNAAIDDMDFAPGEQSDNPIRERYEAYANENGVEALHKLLQQRDPSSAELIHPNNVRRVVRALEMNEVGESYAERKNAFKSVPPYYFGPRIALDAERNVLYDRINARVDKMLELGLVNEVKCLLDHGFRESLTAPQAIGYKEIVSYLDGECTLDDAVELIKRSTRRYAKRQLTWLRSKKDLIWIDVSAGMTQEVYDAASKAIRASLRNGGA